MPFNSLITPLTFSPKTILGGKRSQNFPLKLRKFFSTLYHTSEVFLTLTLQLALKELQKVHGHRGGVTFPIIRKIIFSP